MAIDHQSIAVDPQYDLMRNAPTPKMNEEFNEGGMLESFGDLENTLSFSSDSDVNDLNAMLQNNQTIVFPHGIGSGGSSVQMYPDAMSGAMPASSVQFNLLPGPYGPNGYAGAFPNVSQFSGAYAVSGRESVASQLSTRDRKEKCMSRNAIAARENREKKKNEVNSLRNRLAAMEEENALLKKKYNEVKEAYKEDHERLKYYDALFANFTSNIGSVVSIVDHLKKLPQQNRGKINEQLKEKFNINQNLSICCVIGENREMTLRFCETCSGGSSSKKKAVET